MRQGTDLHASLLHFPPSVVTCGDNPATKTEAAKNETRLNLLSHRGHVTLFLTTEALDIVEALLLLGGWLAPALAFTPRLLCGTWQQITLQEQLHTNGVCPKERKAGQPWYDLNQEKKNKIQLAQTAGLKCSTCAQSPLSKAE